MYYLFGMATDSQVYKLLCFFFFFKQKTAYEISACLVGSGVAVGCGSGAGAEQALSTSIPAASKNADILFAFFVFISAPHK